MQILLISKGINAVKVNLFTAVPEQFTKNVVCQLITRREVTPIKNKNGKKRLQYIIPCVRYLFVNG